MNYNNTYKSIEYSKQSQNRSWGILSFNVNKTPRFSNPKTLSDIYLSRTILYIEKDKTISQIGKMYIPLFSPKYLYFFFKLIFSRQTLGHYLKKHYDNIENNVIFNVKNEFKANTKYSVILNKNEYDVSERVIVINEPKLLIYVEEFK